MRIVEIPFDPHQVIGPADELHARSGGLHLSKVYADLEDTVSPRDNGMTEDDLTWYRMIGFLWEWVIERAFNRGLLIPHCVRPGEFTVDGITGSPDLLDVSVDPVVVIDTKATFKSTNKSDRLEKFFWSWLMQLKGYCYMVETTRARLLILHICGDYRPPRPRVRRFDIDFSPTEIQENWAMLTAHARKRGWL